ncbi:MAG: NADH:ubiquinone oxidoreductase subunit NDUFA12 [Hyphomicrobiales bacterium]|nr:NADH:ubiquinone oxidoreductase subunit NDUFA12 [Hyphomicrobiales bacterium]
MGIFSDIFTWWNGATLSTKLYTRSSGRLVGKDELGNAYYEQKKGVGPHGHPRRWVIYNGEADASKVPGDWHGWLHHTVEAPPTAENYQPRGWQKPHQPNMTGTSAAYRPAGSTLNLGRKAKPQGDYQPWRAE